MLRCTACKAAQGAKAGWSRAGCDGMNTMHRRVELRQRYGHHVMRSIDKAPGLVELDAADALLLRYCSFCRQQHALELVLPT